MTIRILGITEWVIQDDILNIFYPDNRHISKNQTLNFTTAKI
jgi:hypothetical protein